MLHLNVISYNNYSRCPFVQIFETIQTRQYFLSYSYNIRFKNLR